MLKSTLLYIKQGLNTHIGAFSPVIIIEDHIYRVLFIHSGSWAPRIYCVSVESSSLFARLYSWGYSLGFWRIPFSFSLPWGYVLGFWCIPLPCHNLLGDTLGSFGVSPFLLIFLLGYNFSFLGYPSALSQLAWGYAVLFRRIPFSLNLSLGIQL